VSSSTTGADTSGVATIDTVSTSLEETTEWIDESSGSADSGTFIVDPDWGGLCSTLSVCDLWAQDCPEGSKCVAKDGDGDGDGDLEGCAYPSCEELSPDPLPRGSTCTMPDGPWSGADECEIGDFCWGVDPETLEGVCVSNCGGSEANPLCDDGLTCFMGWSGLVTACIRGCDALAPECATGTSCTTKDGDASVCLPDVFGVPATQAAGCDYSVGCGEGFGCVLAAQVADCEDAGSCCTALCDPAAPVCDASVPVCTPLEHDPSVGVCTIE
jgi:hypothetical protein